MKPKALISVMLVVLLGVLACSSSGNDETPSAADPGLNLLVVVEGPAELKREEWSGFHPTAFGTVLHRGDQLRPAKGAKAVVLCDGLTTWTVPAGVPSGLSTGCPPPREPVLVRGGGTIGPSRGASDNSIPYIISPRRTSLLNGQPILRWNEISSKDVTEYRVVIRKEELGDVVWETKAKESGIQFPDDTRLQSGVAYLLVVEAKNGTSSEDEGTPDLRFSLMDEAEVRRVESIVEELEGLELADEAKSFALAQFYAGNDLKAIAIETLEELVKDSSEEAAVYRLLGDLNFQLGLFLLAQSWYEKAIDLSAADGDAEGLAAAQAGLGEVHAALGSKDLNGRPMAIPWLTKARDGYLALGDVQRAAEVTNHLKVITE